MLRCKLLSRGLNLEYPGLHCQLHYQLSQTLSGVMAVVVYTRTICAVVSMNTSIHVLYSYVHSVYHQNTAAPGPCFLNVCSSDQPLAM